MFKKQVESVSNVLSEYLRRGGLETPLLQYRVISAWNNIAGAIVAKYTETKFIKNQTLHVKITNPAVRHDLLMRRSELVKKLNESAGGSLIIVDIHVY